MSIERDAIQARTGSDALRLPRIMNGNQAHGREGARVYPPRAAQEAGLEIDSERYEDAMTFLVKQAALRRDERAGTDPTSSPGGR